jgi:glutathione synthase/RimK-type ligase-like ATP-grasp enzyme
MRFTEEAKSLGHSVQIISYSEASKLQKLPDTKAVIFREPDYKKNIYDLRDRLLKHYVSTKSFTLNANSYLKWSVLDKITQHQEFAKAGIPHIPLLNIEDAKYPFIAKNKLGSHGDSVYKITCKEDLEKVLQKHELEDLLIQEFQNSGFDLRVIVLGGRVLGIMKRMPRKGEFYKFFSRWFCY